MNAHHPPGPRKARRATTVAIDPALIDDDRVERWRAKNAEAVASWNAYVETNGMPLADISVF